MNNHPLTRFEYPDMAISVQRALVPPKGAVREFILMELLSLLLSCLWPFG